MFQGFRTASGMEVKVSEEALECAKKLFERISDSISTDQLDDSHHTGNQIQLVDSFNL